MSDNSFVVARADSQRMSQELFHVDRKSSVGVAKIGSAPFGKLRVLDGVAIVVLAEEAFLRERSEDPIRSMLINSEPVAWIDDFNSGLNTDLGFDAVWTDGGRQIYAYDSYAEKLWSISPDAVRFTRLPDARAIDMIVVDDQYAVFLVDAAGESCAFRVADISKGWLGGEVRVSASFAWCCSSGHIALLGSDGISVISPSALIAETLTGSGYGSDRV